MGAEDNLKEKYDFISEKIKDKEQDYLSYLLIFAFKGQRDFETSPNNVVKCLDNLVDSTDEKILMNNFNCLQNLKGVAFATASAILHFKFPETYAIIDENALLGIEKETGRSLGKIIYDKKDNTPEYSKLKKNIELYKSYLDFLTKNLKVNGGEFESLRQAELHYFTAGKSYKTNSV